jgi:hypothetical protein
MATEWPVKIDQRSLRILLVLLAVALALFVADQSYTPLLIASIVMSVAAGATVLVLIVARRREARIAPAAVSVPHHQNGKGTGARKLTVHVTDRSEALAESTAAHRQARRRRLAWGVPTSALVLAWGTVVFVRSSSGYVAETIAAVVVSIVAPLLIVFCMMCIKARRVSAIKDRLWSSRSATYLGPKSDAGIGAAQRFFRHNNARTGTPVLRVVLAPDRFVLVPTWGPNRPLSCPFAALKQVDVVYDADAGPGLAFITKDGKQACLRFKPDPALVEKLRHLGATVVNS